MNALKKVSKAKEIAVASPAMSLVLEHLIAVPEKCTLTNGFVIDPVTKEVQKLTVFTLFTNAAKITTITIWNKETDMDMVLSIHIPAGFWSLSKHKAGVRLEGEVIPARDRIVGKF